MPRRLGRGAWKNSGFRKGKGEGDRRPVSRIRAPCIIDANGRGPENSPELSDPGSDPVATAARSASHRAGGLYSEQAQSRPTARSSWPYGGRYETFPLRRSPFALFVPGRERVWMRSGPDGAVSSVVASSGHAQPCSPSASSIARSRCTPPTRSGEWTGSRRTGAGASQRIACLGYA